MDVRSEFDRAELTVRLRGELDHHAAPRVRDAIDRQIADRAVRVLTLDMSGVSFMDSSGIGLLIGRCQAMKKKGGRMRVCGASEPVSRVMRLSGLYAILDVVEDAHKNGTRKAGGK